MVSNLMVIGFTYDIFIDEVVVVHFQFASSTLWQVRNGSLEESSVESRMLFLFTHSWVYI